MVVTSGVTPKYSWAPPQAIRKPVITSSNTRVRVRDDDDDDDDDYDDDDSGSHDDDSHNDSISDDDDDDDNDDNDDDDLKGHRISWLALLVLLGTPWLA